MKKVILGKSAMALAILTAASSAQAACGDSLGGITLEQQRAQIALSAAQLQNTQTANLLRTTDVGTIDAGAAYRCAETPYKLLVRPGKNGDNPAILSAVFCELGRIEATSKAEKIAVQTAKTELARSMSTVPFCPNR